MSIITVQCGNYANYVGAHFWNIQESDFEYQKLSGIEQAVNTTNHDVLYREGVTFSRQTTYTPRLVAIDLKGSLGTLPELGDLYGGPGLPKSGVQSWYGDVDIVKAEPVRKNRFLQDLMDEEGGDEDLIEGEKDRDTIAERKVNKNKEEHYKLDEEVNHWSDYLYSRFHPKSILVADSFQHNNTTHPFDMYGLGTTVWNDTHQELGDQIEDRVRFFAEECDELQGFHLMADLHNGFSGVASRLNTMLVDDYSAKSVVNFPVGKPVLQEYNFNSCSAYLANSTLLISSLLEDGLVTPLSLAQDWFPLQTRTNQISSLQYNPDLDYHTSCILASTIDTATLAYRQQNSLTRMPDVVYGLPVGDKKLASLSVSLPLHLTETNNFETDLFTKLSPLLPTSNKSLNNSPSSSARSPNLLTLRGVLKTALFKHRNREYSSLSTPEEYFEYCASQQLNSIPRIYCHAKPLRTLKPYPEFFNPEVSQEGQVESKPRQQGEQVQVVPLLTSWSTGSEAGASVQLLATRCKKLNFGKLPRLLDSGVEEQEWSEAVEKILATAEAYQDLDQ